MTSRPVPRIFCGMRRLTARMRLIKIYLISKRPASVHLWEAEPLLAKLILGRDVGKAFFCAIL